jgi:pimeloyl-ACP methyl ester carboxylesterase
MHKLHLFILFFPLILILSCNSNQNEKELEEATGKEIKSEQNNDRALPYVIYNNKENGFDSIASKFATLYESTEIYSLDSLVISANYYHANDDATSILLCHQARWNKYEYDSIAVALQAKGYNCLAIDQRSGGIMGTKGENLGPINSTFLRAKKAELPTNYLDAEQDILASIRYLYTKNGDKAVILWGSSYSSTLALYTGLNNDSVAAVVSFSPGDYFSEEKGSLLPILKETEKAFFLTSSKEESKDLNGLVKDKELNNKQILFVPKGEGYHGSRALWSFNEGNEEYWDAISIFLDELK